MQLLLELDDTVCVHLVHDNPTAVTKLYSELILTGLPMQLEPPQDYNILQLVINFLQQQHCVYIDNALFTTVVFP